MPRPAEALRPTALLQPGLMLTLLAACGPVEADHPLDPDTPPEKQQPSRLSGRLVAPAEADVERFADARVGLWTADVHADGAVIQVATYSTPIDAGGRFRFDAVVPGTYRFGPHTLVARAPGYDPLERHVVLDPGERLLLDPIELPHASTGPDAVWLDARVEDATGLPIAGVTLTVRVDDVPFARAVSDRDGRISAAAARADRYWLDADTADYAPATVGPLVWWADREAFRGLEGEPPTLVLTPLP